MAFVERQWRHVETGVLTHSAEIPAEFNWEEVNFNPLNGKYVVVLEAVLQPVPEEELDSEDGETLSEEVSPRKNYIVGTIRRTAHDGMVAVTEEIEADHIKFHENGTLILFVDKSTVVALFAAGSWTLCMEASTPKAPDEDD